MNSVFEQEKMLLIRVRNYFGFKKPSVLKLFQVYFVFCNTTLLRMLFLTLCGSHAYGFGGWNKTNKPFLFLLQHHPKDGFGTAELEIGAWLGVREGKKVGGVLQHLLSLLLADTISVEHSY